MHLRFHSHIFAVLGVSQCIKSYLPRIHLSWTPGRSCVRPGRTKTTLCSCSVCRSPGMYAIISFPLLSRTRQHLRWAELGFFGFRIISCKMTPFIWGCGPMGLCFFGLRLIGPLRIIWLIVLMHRELVWRPERAPTSWCELLTQILFKGFFQKETHIPTKHKDSNTELKLYIK